MVAGCKGGSRLQGWKGQRQLERVKTTQGHQLVENLDLEQQVAKVAVRAGYEG